MDSKQHQQLTQLLDDVKANPNRRAEFLSDPLKTLAPMVGTRNISSAQLSLSNEVLLETMRNPKLLDELRDFSVEREAGQINDTELAQRTARSLSQHLPNDLIERLNYTGIKDPGNPVAIANLLVHVDVVAILTQAAVLHSEVVFNGMADPSVAKLKDFANVLAKGQ